jgi:hypothetical protein
LLINEFDYQHFEGQGVKVTHGTAMRYLANLQIHVKPQNKKVGKFLEGTKRVQQIKPVSAEFLRTG